MLVGIVSCQNNDYNKMDADKGHNLKNNEYHDSNKPESRIELEFTSEGIIKPEIAEMIIQETSFNIIKALKNKDTEIIAEYVHPVKGVRFTPYTHVSPETDLVFDRNKMEKYFSDQEIYTWGIYDGIGDEINLSPGSYYEKFIYSQDFINAPEIGYNQVLSRGNMLENQFEVYENPIVVEYYFPGFNTDYEGLDWRSLRLVFEEYEGEWKLVGIIHNQWTI